jgi:hypothetical protein
MAFFNAVMDATENEPNFNESIFKNLNRKFWLKTVSWEYAKRIRGYKFDAWHLAKSSMIVMFACVVVSGIFFGAWVFEHNSPKVIVLAVITNLAVGFTWVAVFTLFYHKIFKVK